MVLPTRGLLVEIYVPIWRWSFVALLDGMPPSTTVGSSHVAYRPMTYYIPQISSTRSGSSLHINADVAVYEISPNLASTPVPLPHALSFSEGAAVSCGTVQRVRCDKYFQPAEILLGPVTHRGLRDRRVSPSRQNHETPLSDPRRDASDAGTPRADAHRDPGNKCHRIFRGPRCL